MYSYSSSARDEGDDDMSYSYAQRAISSAVMNADNEHASGHYRVRSSDFNLSKKPSLR